MFLKLAPALLRPSSPLIGTALRRGAEDNFLLLTPVIVSPSPARVWVLRGSGGSLFFLPSSLSPQSLCLNPVLRVLRNDSVRELNRVKGSRGTEANLNGLVSPANVYVRFAHEDALKILTEFPRWSPSRGICPEMWRANVSLAAWEWEGSRTEC